MPAHQLGCHAQASAFMQSSFVDQSMIPGPKINRGKIAMLADAISAIAPRFLWRHRIASWGISTGEQEERLLSQLCLRSLSTIDVGAAEGDYTAHGLLYSRNVIAFEPRPEAARKLKKLFKTRLVAVEEVALSDARGTVAMRVPRGQPMLSSIDQGNTLEGAPPADTVTVETARLDYYKFTSVGFIKIDVEGMKLRF